MARARSKVKKGDTVKVQYTCKLSNGTVIDSSIGREALEFTLGKEEVIKGLEEAVAGMKVGESKTVTVAAEKAYGRRHDEWVLEVGRDKLRDRIRKSAIRIREKMVIHNAAAHVSNPL
jgi:peptidylprolyl isomerase